MTIDLCNERKVTDWWNGGSEDDSTEELEWTGWDDDELNKARTPLSKRVEEANINLNFEPLVVFPTGQPGRPLAGIARKEGIRL